jgi:protein phosphatase PTC7
MDAINYFLLSAAFMIPHPNKANPDGEDSYFISKKYNVIGVADGVGHWSTVAGADASFWSNEIMKRCSSLAGFGSPRDILIRAISGLSSKIQGSTTVSIAQLSHNVIEAYIVGDSGLTVFRDGEVLRQARLTTSGFNTPNQIGSQGIEQARDGAATRILVREGDVVVLATDGLWDNVHPDQIGKVLSSLREVEENDEFVMAAAEKLAEMANRNGADPTCDSPFARHAQEAGKSFTGGKLDDVTVIVALVMTKPEKATHGKRHR